MFTCNIDSVANAEKMHVHSDQPATHIQQGAHSAHAEWLAAHRSDAGSHLNTIWQEVAYSFLAEDTCDQNCSDENSCLNW